MVSPRLPAAAALAILLAAIPEGARAQAEGAFPAVLTCEAAAGGRDRVTFTLNVANGRASYRVRVGAGEETGSGTLVDGSRLVLSGAVPGPNGHSVRYSGQITGRGGVLSGRRQPTKGGEARTCQILLGDG